MTGWCVNRTAMKFSNNNTPYANRLILVFSSVLSYVTLSYVTLSYFTMYCISYM